MPNMRIITIGILAAVPFVVPLYVFSFDISTMLTIVSLIFAILVGFFFAAATSNYQRLQTLIAEANSGMVSIFSLACATQPGAQEPLADAIDDYMITALDYPLLDYFSKTDKEFDRICKEIDKISPTDEKGLSILSFLHEKKGVVRQSVHELTLVSRPVIGAAHWAVVIIFAIIIGVLIMTLRDGALVSSIITAMVLIAIYLVLDLLYAVDINLFLADKLEFQIPQSVFIGIGRLPYYPMYAIKSKYIRHLPQVYRCGKMDKHGVRIIDVVGQVK